MDFSKFLIAGVQPLVLVPGLVQFIKSVAGIKDKAAEALTVGTGAFMIGLAYALNSDLIPAVAVPWINLTVVAVAGGLAIAGYYKLIKSAAQGIITASTSSLAATIATAQRQVAEARGRYDFRPQ